MNSVQRIIDWNSARYNQDYNHALTIALLSEELTELRGAGSDVDVLDALIDGVYIAIGAMWKLGLNEEQIIAAIHVVCDSNDSKSVAKTIASVKANVDKGPNFTAPEPRLQEILDERV